MKIIPAAAILLALSGPAWSAPAPQAPSLQPVSEKYTFRIDGKVIGTQDAALMSSTASTQTWSFNMNLTVPMYGQTTQLAQSGQIVVDNAANPVSLTTTVTLDKKSQNETLAFSNNKVSISLAPPITAVPASFQMSGPSYLLINNIITTFSIVTRSNRLPVDKPTMWQMFNANLLQPVVLTLTPSSAVTLHVHARPVKCHIFDVSPIGNRLWVSDDDGGVEMVSDPAQKLEIVRD